MRDDAAKPVTAKELAEKGAEIERLQVQFEGAVEAYKQADIAKGRAGRSLDDAQKQFDDMTARFRKQAARDTAWEMDGRPKGISVAV